MNCVTCYRWHPSLKKSFFFFNFYYVYFILLVTYVCYLIITQGGVHDMTDIESKGGWTYFYLHYLPNEGYKCYDKARIHVGLLGPIVLLQSFIPNVDIPWQRNNI